MPSPIRQMSLWKRNLETNSCTGEYTLEMKVEICKSKNARNCSQTPLEAMRVGWDKLSLIALANTNLGDTFILAFWPQNCETIHLCYLNHPICGTWLWKNQEVNIRHNSFYCALQIMYFFTNWKFRATMSQAQLLKACFLTAFSHFICLYHIL